MWFLALNFQGSMTPEMFRSLTVLCDDFSWKGTATRSKKGEIFLSLDEVMVIPYDQGNY
jgi:hypothetical protein